MTFSLMGNSCTETPFVNPLAQPHQMYSYTQCCRTHGIGLPSIQRVPKPGSERRARVTLTASSTSILSALEHIHMQLNQGFH